MKHVLVFYQLDDKDYESFLKSIKEEFLSGSGKIKDYASDEDVCEDGSSSLWDAYFHDL